MTINKSIKYYKNKKE